MDAAPPARPDLYVVARFLDRLGEAGDGVPRTKLQGAVRLNYDLYRAYLALLVGKGWATVTDDADGVARVRLTRAGREARERLVTWIRDAFGDLRL